MAVEVQRLVKYISSVFIETRSITCILNNLNGRAYRSSLSHALSFTSIGDKSVASSKKEELYRSVYHIQGVIKLVPFSKQRNETVVLAPHIQLI